MTDSLSESVLSETVALLRVQHATAQQVAASLAQSLNDRHPRLIETQARVATVGRMIDEELRRISQSALSDYERAAANEAQLAAKLAALEDENADTNGKLVGLHALQREARARRVVFEAFLVRYREIEEQKGINTSVARVISPATPPDRRSGPSSAVLLGLALFFGAALGGAAAYTSEQFDRKIRSRDQLVAVTGLPVLGEISLDAPGKASAGETPTLLNSDALPAIVYHQPRSAAAASFARILGALRRNADTPGRGHTIMVTATAEGDGKSTVALNLALSAAVGGERVLLVDGDLISQHLSRHCDETAFEGATNSALGRSPVAAALSEIPGTSILALRSLAWAGPGSPTKPTRQEVADLLQSADGFATIVVDGPLLGPDQWLQSLAGNMDNIVVVARAGHTDAERLSEGMSFLPSPRVLLCASVLVCA